MKPDVVVDIGNSRIKWGRCVANRVDERIASLPGSSAEEWEKQTLAWQLRTPIDWAVAGVQPAWQSEFTRWAESRGDRVRAITRKAIPVPVEVDEPDAIGLDRLLNAAAAIPLLPEGISAVIISVGTAVTVDLLRDDGVFAGGTIFPGPRLMAESLHRFTAKLPLVEIDRVESFVPPGKNTEAAIETGISFAIMGGASLLVKAMAGLRKSHTWVIMTGGGLGSLARFDFGDVGNTIIRPTLTLDGVRIAAETLP